MSERAESGSLDSQQAASLDPTTQRRRRWLPEASAETAATLRLLSLKPWLVAGRDDEAIAAVRRNITAIREALARLGWVLVVEKDVVRLRKSPPVRRDAWAATGPAPIQASWFFLLVAAAESVAPRLALSSLVNAARAAAAEAGLELTHDIAERRAIVCALRMLDERGVVIQVDGDVEGFVQDENAPVLLAVYHSRLAHVIANFGPVDPSAAPATWLEHVEHEPDPARRMRRRLVDDAIIHIGDLDVAESDWLSRRLRGDDGGPLATAFGLCVERRAEGAAFVLPDDAFRYLHELGATPFPAPGTIPHAALLLCEHAGTEGAASSANIGPGWRGVAESKVLEHLEELASRHSAGQGGWRRELVEDPGRLAHEVRALLTGLDLLRVHTEPGAEPVWWFSAGAARWSPPRRAARPHAERGEDRLDSPQRRTSRSP